MKRNKIVFISHFFPRLPVFDHHGSWALDQAKALSENYKVEVVTIKPNINWFMKLVSQKFRDWDRIYDVVSLNDNLNIRYFKVNPIAFKARNLLYRYPGFFSRYFSKVYGDYILEWGPDLVISNHTLIEGAVFERLQGALEVPHVVFEHSPDDYIPRSRIHRTAYQKIISAADAFVNVSKYSEEKISDFYTIGPNATVLYNYSMDAKKYKNRESNLIDFEDDYHYVVSVGAYEIRKNHKALIGFVEGNKGLLEKWKFIIVGASSDYYNPIKEEIKNKNLDDYFILLKDVSHEALLGLLNKVDVFALLSFSEMFSVAVVEAMSAGLPIIVTKENGTSDGLFKHSIIAVDPNNHDEIRNGLIKLVNSKGIRDDLGDKNRKLFENYFTYDGYIKRFDDLIKGIRYS